MAARLGKDALTMRQRKLINGLVPEKDTITAAKEAGYCKDSNAETTRVVAWKTMRKPKVAAALEKALDKAGASLDASARVISEAHNAKLAMTGSPDHPIRLKAAELNLRARRAVGSNSAENENGDKIIPIGFLVVKAAQERSIEFEDIQPENNQHQPS